MVVNNKCVVRHTVAHCLSLTWLFDLRPLFLRKHDHSTGTDTRKLRTNCPTDHTHWTIEQHRVGRIVKHRLKVVKRCFQKCYLSSSAWPSLCAQLCRSDSLAAVRERWRWCCWLISGGRSAGARTHRQGASFPCAEEQLRCFYSTTFIWQL